MTIRFARRLKRLGFILGLLSAFAIAADGSVDSLARQISEVSSEDAKRDERLNSESVQALLKAYTGTEPSGEVENRAILVRWLGSQDASPVVVQFLPALIASALEKEDVVMGEPVRKAVYSVIGSMKLTQFEGDMRVIILSGEDPAVMDAIRAFGKLVAAHPASTRAEDIGFLRELLVTKPIAAPAIVDAIALSGLDTQLVKEELLALLKNATAALPVSAKLRTLEWIERYPQALPASAITAELQRLALDRDSAPSVALMASDILEDWQKSTPEIHAKNKENAATSPHIRVSQGVPVQDLQCLNIISELRRRHPK